MSGNAAAVSAARYWLSRISTSLFLTRIVPLGVQSEPAAELVGEAVGGWQVGSVPAGVFGSSARVAAGMVRAGPVQGCRRGARDGGAAGRRYGEGGDERSAAHCEGQGGAEGAAPVHRHPHLPWLRAQGTRHRTSV